MRYSLVVFLIAASSTALGQPSNLPIGSVRLTLGAEKTVVMDELRSRYHIVNVSGQPETFFVSDGKPPNIKVIGSVSFENGRLSWIQRKWGHFSGKVSATDVSKALFAAVEGAAKASAGAVVVTTDVRRVPGGEFKTIYFQFADRRIIFSTTDGDASLGGQQVNIDESVKLAQR